MDVNKIFIICITCLCVVSTFFLFAQIKTNGDNELNIALLQENVLRLNEENNILKNNLKDNCVFTNNLIDVTNLQFDVIEYNSTKKYNRIKNIDCDDFLNNYS